MLFVACTIWCMQDSLVDQPQTLISKLQFIYLSVYLSKLIVSSFEQFDDDSSCELIVKSTTGKIRSVEYAFKMIDLG